MLASCRLAFACLAIASAALGDLNWGGGAARYFTDDATPLTEETGLATLIAVKSGGFIDSPAFVPETPADVLTAGTTIADGNGNENVVVATTNAFISGYLMNSFVRPDVTTADQQAMGVPSGALLYLRVWDRSTFSGDVPAEGSRFTAHQLFVDGEPSAPATAFGTAPPALPTVVTGSSASQSHTCDVTIDVTAPQISLEAGTALVQLPIGAPQPDILAGVSAADNVDGDLTDEVATVGSVVTNNEGDYTVTYDVADAAGNDALTVTRTYRITAPRHPYDTNEDRAITQAEADGMKDDWANEKLPDQGDPDFFLLWTLDLKAAGGYRYETGQTGYKVWQPAP